VQTSG